MCPYCKSVRGLSKSGSYLRKSDKKRLRRFKCLECKVSFSETVFSIDYRLRKRDINQGVFTILCSGVSQRRTAYAFSIKPIGIARRVDRFGRCAAHNLDAYRRTRPKVAIVQLDEMESFEHTKCKPLTIPIAVEQGTRKILSLKVGVIAAKGRLAAISRERYGKRKCQRQQCLDAVLTDLKICFVETGLIKSDQSPHYPKPFKKHFPLAHHQATKGMRGSDTGLGELKKGGFDPIFSLNHSYAMFRDNLKTLSRRTWCTSKRMERLELLMNMYAWFHNLRLDNKKKPVKLCWLDPAPIG